MKHQKSSHATYDVRYHVVWVTKYRNPVLTEDMQKRLDFLIRKISEKIWVVIIKLWFEEDHVHMYCRIPLTKPISTVIWYIKWSSSFAIKWEFSKEIKKWYWKTGNIWAVWFFVASVGEVNDEIVSKYVENQWKKENEVTEIEL